MEAAERGGLIQQKWGGFILCCRNAGAVCVLVFIDLVSHCGDSAAPEQCGCSESLRDLQIIPPQMEGGHSCERTDIHGKPGSLECNAWRSALCQCPAARLSQSSPGRKGRDVSSFYKGRDKGAGVGWVWFGIITPVTTPIASSLKKFTYSKTRSGHANAIGIQTIKSVFRFTLAASVSVFTFIWGQCSAVCWPEWG